MSDLPVCASHRRAVLSLLAVSTHRPSLLKTALLTNSGCFITTSGLPFRASQICALPALRASSEKPPVSTHRPSGLNAAHPTPPPGFIGGRRGLPVSACHTLTSETCVGQ